MYLQSVIQQIKITVSSYNLQNNTLLVGYNSFKYSFKTHLRCNSNIGSKFSCWPTSGRFHDKKEKCQCQIQNISGVGKNENWFLLIIEYAQGNLMGFCLTNDMNNE